MLIKYVDFITNIIHTIEVCEYVQGYSLSLLLDVWISCYLVRLLSIVALREVNLRDDYVSSAQSLALRVHLVRAQWRPFRVVFRGAGH